MDFDGFLTAEVHCSRSRAWHLKDVLRQSCNFLLPLSRFNFKHRDVILAPRPATTVHRKHFFNASFVTVPFCPPETRCITASLIIYNKSFNDFCVISSPSVRFPKLSI